MNFFKRLFSIGIVSLVVAIFAVDAHAIGWKINKLMPAESQAVEVGGSQYDILITLERDADRTKIHQLVSAESQEVGVVGTATWMCMVMQKPDVAGAARINELVPAESQDIDGAARCVMTSSKSIKDM